MTKTDPELEALNTICLCLERLEPDARRRAVEYVEARWGGCREAMPSPGARPSAVERVPSVPHPRGESVSTMSRNHRTVVVQDADGTWVGQNELARRLKLSPSGIAQWLVTHGERLEAELHFREHPDKGRLYNVEEMRDIRSRVAAEKEQAREGKGEDGSRLERLLQETA